MSTALRSPAAERESISRSQGPPFYPTAYLAFVQGVYYLVAGVWPLVSIDTFQRVTGPKTDLWLVHTVGALVAVIGAVILSGVLRRRATAEVVVLAIASASALIAVDVVFVVQKVIAPIYLLDAAAEAVLIVGWLAALVVEARTLWRRSSTCL